MAHAQGADALATPTHMPNLVVIFGPPASGKAAVGYELAARTGYRFFYNHLTADPVAALFGWRSERFRPMVDAVRDCLFREAASDPSISGVIFTFVWGFGVPEDHAIMERTASLFTRSGGRVVFVELQASLEARVEREGTPFRVGLKPIQRDVDGARARQVEFHARYRMNTDGALPLPYPHLILDTETTLQTRPPGESVASSASALIRVPSRYDRDSPASGSCGLRLGVREWESSAARKAREPRSGSAVGGAGLIRAVFFDLDGTLYDRDALVSGLFSAQYDVFRPELRGVSKGQFVQRLLELDAHGYGRKEAVYRQVADEWGLSQGSADRLLQHFWSEYDGNLKVDPVAVTGRAPDDTRTTLEALRRRGKALAVITNGGTVRQLRKMELLGLVPFFDAVLISESEGVRKPQPEIFRRALDRCGVEAHETLFVGDHPEADVAGAQAAGLIPVWKFVPYWRLTTEHVRTVHRLTEILPLCSGEADA